ncbi:MAG TPA: gephyrin-like molybdotransferase Glp [Longilinea sp.]|nr:gephyrin-like molybdotransferase Glp [Longilinea sp.]
MKKETTHSALLSVSEAQDIILAAVQTVQPESILLQQGLGRILAAELSARFDMPPFANSSADGYAVRADDTRNANAVKPVVLKVVGDIPAGSNPDFNLQPGEAARIMTGAIVPDGADAVVMVEATDIYAQGLDAPLPQKISLSSPVRTGDSIRPRGQDASAGTMLFPIGHRLLPQDLGLLSSQGFPTIPVFRQPRVGLLSTGDELVAQTEPLLPGKIYDSNSFMLNALLIESGAMITHSGFVPDDEGVIRERLNAMVESGADLLITSAGVSVGPFDFIRKIIFEQGAMTFWKVDVRPGKPLAFGNYRGVPVIGLPGNPVSSFVGCLIFVIPAIRKMAGSLNQKMVTLKAKLSEPVESDGRESYLRAIIENRSGNRFVKLSGHQGSGNLFALTRANALLILPSGVKSLPAGADVNVYPFSNESAWK